MSSADVIINFPDVHVTSSFHQATSKKESNLNLKWRLYPNPASEFITIEFANSMGEDTEIRLYDMSGKLVLRQDLGMLPYGNNSIRIELDALTSGLYFYELQSGESISSEKFIKR